MIKIKWNHSPEIRKKHVIIYVVMLWQNGNLEMYSVTIFRKNSVKFTIYLSCESKYLIFYTVGILCKSFLRVKLCLVNPSNDKSNILTQRPQNWVLEGVTIKMSKPRNNVGMG